MKTEERPDQEVKVREDGVRVPRSLVRAGAFSWRIVAMAAAGYILIYVLIELRLVVFPVIVATFIATLLAPPANWLRSKRWPPLLATWAVMVGALLVLAGIGGFVGPQVASEMSTIGQDVQRGTERVLDWLARGPLELSRVEVNSYVQQASRTLQENSSTISSGVVAGAVAVGEVIAGLLLTFVLVFFFVKDGDRMFEWGVSRLAESRRQHAREMGLRAWATVGAYIRGTAVIALVDAVLIGIALFLIGVPVVIPLMVLTFFAGFFPVVGAIVAGAIAALVALVSGGPLDALLVVGAATIIQQVEGDILQPIVLSRAIRLHPVVVLLALTAGGILGGIAGAFLAVPATAVATSVGSYLRSINSPSDVRTAG